MDFVHLHVHSVFSKLDSILKLPDMVQKVQESGMKAIAITDHRNITGWIKFYVKAIEAGIKPILGCEINEIEDHTIHSEKQLQELGYKDRHLVLIAKNNTGFHNLIKIISEASTNGLFDGKERISLHWIKQNNLGEGIIATTACMFGRFGQYVLNGQIDEAKDFLLQLQDTFDKVYLETQATLIPEYKIINQVAIDFSRQLGIPLIVTKDVHYLNQEDAVYHARYIAIQHGRNADLTVTYPDFYLATPQEMLEQCLLLGIPLEAIENTVAIAEECNVVLDTSKKLPHIDVGEDSNDYLYKLCYDSLFDYCLNNGLDIEPYLERLDHEFEVIKAKGFADYFLILKDILDYCDREGIARGPGRGSAAGSLIAFLLGITKLDPLKYDLLFERFLNPERESLPDIDTDICYENRSKVIEYIKNRFGADKVAQIVTNSKLKIKVAIKDIMRILGYSAQEAQKLSDIIPAKLPDQTDPTIDKFEDMLENPDKYIDEFGPEEYEHWINIIKRFYEEVAKYPNVLETIQKISGGIRQFGVHAAGVVIAPDTITNYFPIGNVSKSAILPVLLWDMEDIEVLGGLKMDMLALKTLTIIDKTVKQIQKGEPEFSLDNIDLNDRNVYRMLSQGYTTGVFQISGYACTEICKKLRPQNFEELIDLLALARPGPMTAKMDNGLTMVEQYIKNKEPMAVIEYLHPDLEPILSSTKGIMLYQEQIMRITQVFAGYSLGEADQFRKAIGKKKKELLEELGKDFIERAVARGYSRELMETMYHQILKFAGYSFNKSHSASYALIAYYTAYLKYYYPAYFMATSMSVYADNSDKIFEYMQESKNLGITILPPDINKSKDNFIALDRKTIIYSLLAIKNVGDKAVQEILLHQPYSSFEDFLTRVNRRVVNKRVIDTLIMAGVFDCFEPNRYKLYNYFHMYVAKDDAQLYDESSWNNQVKYQLEKEYFGVYLSGHPLEGLPSARLSKVPTGSTVDIAGYVKRMKGIKDRNGNDMCFIRLETMYETVDVTVFASVYADYSSRIKENTVIVVRGKKDIKGGFIAEAIFKTKANNQIVKRKPPSKNKTKQKKQKEEPKIIDLSFFKSPNKDPLLDLGIGL